MKTTDNPGPADDPSDEPENSRELAEMFSEFATDDIARIERIDNNTPGHELVGERVWSDWRMRN